MTIDPAAPDNSASPRPWPFALLAILLALMFNAYSGDFATALGAKAWFAGIPYGRSVFLNTADMVVMLLCFWLIGGVGISRQWRIAGLGRPILPPLIFGALIFVPVTAILFFATQLSSGAGIAEIAFGGVVFPMFEEIVFRGLAIGVLMVRFRWPFLVAALIPSLFFGVFHMYQGDSLMESLGIAAITGFGGIWFGWIYWKWGFNLWPAFLLHAGLNSLWTLFDLGDNAMGGQLGNVMRIAVIIASIILTLWGRGLIDRLAHQPDSLNSGAGQKV
ncbi:MAG: CPBP family intramembrane glutamic endopeptidase [Pseudomonadota bacterium]